MSFSSLLVMPTSAISLQRKLGQKDLLFWMVFSQLDFSRVIYINSFTRRIWFKLFLGMAVSGLIKEHLGFYGNFSLGMFFALLAMFYAIFFLKVSCLNWKKVYCNWNQGFKNNETPGSSETDRNDGKVWRYPRNKRWNQNFYIKKDQIWLSSRWTRIILRYKELERSFHNSFQEARKQHPDVHHHVE